MNCLYMSDGDGVYFINLDNAKNYICNSHSPLWGWKLVDQELENYSYWEKGDKVEIKWKENGNSYYITNVIKNGESVKLDERTLKTRFIIKIIPEDLECNENKK